MRAWLLTLALSAGWVSGQPAPKLQWSQLPSIPDRLGFAGSYAGVSNGALIVAGGTNFPVKPVWESGPKIWYDHVYLLDRPDGTWREAGKLPRPAAYGASVAIPGGLLFIGGGDADRNFTTVWNVKRIGDRVEFEAWPALPVPLAMAAAARVGHTVYLAGGTDQPPVTSTRKIFLALNLDDPAAGWKKLEPCPGLDRAVPIASASGEDFYLVSGSAGGKERVWLRDAWTYRPGAGWRRIADLPEPAVAAPSPAPSIGGRILIFGGDDGRQAKLPQQTHRGFSRHVLAYDPRADRWEVIGDLPFSLVTTALAEWNGQIVIPGGEARPGVRSPAVWSAVTLEKKDHVAP